MRNVCTSSLLLLIFSSAALATIPPCNGWYASIFGGYSYVPDNVSNITNTLWRSHPSYNNGWNGGGRFGYQSLPLRYEGEISYVSANLHGFQINSIEQFPTSGESTGTFAMLNVYYDFPEMAPYVSPFIGVGLGYGRVTASLNGYGQVIAGVASNGQVMALGPTVTTRFKIIDDVVAYNATAGFTYNFSPSYSVNLAYRYIGTERAEGFGKTFQAHLASAGVVYRFGVFIL